MRRKRKLIDERIIGKYEQRGQDECWPWTGARTSANYGHLLADGGDDGARKTVLAHRAMYELHVGPIPEEAVLDHACHTRDLTCPGNERCEHRACVNPAHLEPVLFGENCMRGRGIAPRNAAKTHCHNGHEYTPDNVRLDKNGARVCRKCAAARLRRWKERHPDYVPPNRRR